MSFTYTDAHTHFWDSGVMPYPWLAEVPAIAGRHTPEELVAEAAAQPPSRIVFVECGAPQPDEVNWVERLAAAEPRLAAIVAQATMDAGARTTAVLAGLASRPLVRGVRHLIQDEKDPEYCLRPEFLAGVQQLEAFDLSFDICCRHHQLPAVIELVRRCPQVRFILDHAGKPGVRAGLLDPWRGHIASLAALPNIDCKLSGLVTEAEHERWVTADLQPYVGHLLATFGPSRLLFGGDWPVAKLASGYLRWLAAARDLTAHLTPEAQSVIFQHTATRAYRIG
ncbi:MAG: amidohydrolase family protein [Opitutaceae bacterium]|nr:amidohydrolase family protein [Opitutaceae bacterium]